MATPLLPPSSKTGKIVGKKISTNALFGKNKKSSAIVKTGGSSIQLRPKISSALVKRDDNIVGEDIGIGFNQVEEKFISIKETLDGLLNLFLSKKKQKVKDSNKERIEEEKDKKKKEEAKLEKPKIPKVSGVKLPSLPRFSFLDTILNFFGSILLGSLLNFLLTKRKFIFAALDDVLNGFDNILNLIKYSIISLSNTSKGLIKSIAKIGTRLFKGPAQFTSNLLSRLGKSIKNLLVRTGKAVNSFVSGTFKNISGMAAGAASTRATGTAKRVDPSKTRAIGRSTRPRPTGTRATGSGTLKRAEKLFGEKGAKHLGKVSNIFKKIPFIGALIGIGIDLAMGERLDNAIAGAAGASLGAAIGGAIGTFALPIPGVGSFLGGVVGAAIGDWAGKEIYRKISGQVSQINPPVEDLEEPEPSQSSGPTGSRMLPGDAPPEVNAALEAIAGAEGGWNSVNPGKVVPGLTNMTIAQAREVGMRQRSIAGSGALGKFQQIPVYNGVNVLKQRAETAGLNYEKDKFNEENQTKITRAYIAGIYPGGESQLIKDARKDPMIIASKLRGVYPSLPGGSQKNVHTSGYMSRFRNALRSYQGAGGMIGGTMGSRTGLVTGYGGGTPFHVDTRWARNTPMEVLVPMMDSMARTLAAEGRVMEMGQAGSVTGKRYPLNGSFEQKKKFLQAATAGHHTQRGMAAMDYFIPKVGETRFGKSAEFANIPAPALPEGYKLRFFNDGVMAGYEVLDRSGRVMFRTLHGDPRRSTTGLIGSNAPSRLAERARRVSRQASYEGQQQIVPVALPIGGNQNVSMVSGGAASPIVIPVGISKKEALNSYYQSQLIGFLYKQG